MIEAEIKLPITDREELEHRLEQNGFQKGRSVREEDLYFNSLQHDFRSRDEALRLRRVICSGKEEVLLTFKSPKLDRVSMTREELETPVGDLETMRAVLHALGYDLEYPVYKTRQYYKKESLTACVDQVELLGTFLELEILLPDETGHEAALLALENVLAALGHTMQETTRTSYLSMLMQNGSV